MAERFHLSILQWHHVVGDRAWVVDVPGVRPPNLGHGRHHLSSIPTPAAHLVRSDLVHLRSKERRLGPWAATRPRVRLLRDGVGYGCTNSAGQWSAPERDRIGGPGVSVEMDCTFIGGRAGKGRKRYENKAEVAVAIELCHPKGYGRVRLAHIDTATRKDHLLEFIEENILPGTILYTDGEAAYNAIPKRLDITHERIVLTTSTAAAHDLLPGVHCVAALLKRWLTGTLHDGQSAAQLAYYLDEFTFRFNRRASRSRGLLWYRLIQQALNTDPHPYTDIISH